MNIENKNIYLYDDDTENQLGEIHQVVNIINTENGVVLEMDNKDRYHFSELTDYEKELVLSKLIE